MLATARALHRHTAPSPPTLPLVLALISFAACSSVAETLYVRTGGDNDTAVPGDPSMPYATPAAAHSAAVDGDVLDIGPGEFTGRVFISKNITVNGAGVDQTFLQAAGSPGQSSLDVVTVSSATVVVTDLTVRHGGGGVRLSGSSPAATLERVRVTLNQSTSFGSGIRLNSGQLLVSDCEITHNSSGSFATGAGLHNFTGEVTLTNTLVANNTSAGDAGGIYNAGNLQIQGCTIRDNQAGSENDGSDAGEGGGIFNQGTLTISDSTLSGNHAGDATGGGDGGNGGAIHHFGGDLTISASTFDHNSAGDGLNGGAGGGIYARAGTLTITNSTIDENSTGSNSTENADGTDTSGGGLFLRNAVTCRLLFNTVTRNSCTGGGTGGGLHAIPGGDPQIGGCVFAENTTQTGGGTDLVAVFTDTGGNYFSSYTGWLGTPVEGARPSVFGEFGEILDPGLGELRDNGGPTHTRRPDPGSPLIDIGPDTATIFDQIGTPRPQGGAPDAGAVEHIDRQGVDLQLEHLSFDRTDPANDALVYFAIVRNRGDQTATRVALEVQIDPAPGNEELGHTLTSNDPDITILSNHRISHSPDKPIPPQEFYRYILRVVIPPSQTGNYTVRASTTSLEPDLNPADNLTTTPLDLGGDSDDDGVNDLLDPDDDGDGMDDFYEERFGLDPLDPSDAEIDNDGDGIDNRGEIHAGTDPNDADSRYEIVDFVAERHDTKVTARFVLPTTDENTDYEPHLYDLGEWDHVSEVKVTDHNGQPVTVRDQGLFFFQGTGGRVTVELTVCPSNGLNRPVDTFLVQVNAIPIRE